MTRWDALGRRVAAAERAAGARRPVQRGPWTGEELAAAFTVEETQRFEDIAKRNPDCGFTARDLWMLSDDDVEYLAEVAERVAKRDAEGPPG